MTSTPQHNWIEALEGRIADRHVLKHPFYQAWNEGTLSLAALQDYAAQYYHHVSAFPTYLSAVHSNTADADARRTLLGNLMDEEAGSPNHPELWLQFAEGLGVPTDNVKNTPACPETAALVNTFQDICRNQPFTDGIAALYAYESQVPEVAQSKIDGLRNHYSVNDSATLAYFNVHIGADEAHRAEELALLKAHVQTEGQEQGAIDAASRSLDAVWNLLSGVCHRHGVVCN